MRGTAVLAAAVVFVAPLAVPPPAQLDHVVVAIRSLEEGIAQFEQLVGVKAGVGGKHPGRGTENALVSLGGGSYLEIIAPQAGATLSAEDEEMRRLEHLTVIGWAVSVPDVDGSLSALQRAGFTTSPIRPGARLTPSGERLEWSTFGLDGTPIAVAPFFIHWSANTRHPSTTAPGGCGIDHVVVRDPQSDRLRAALTALGVGRVRSETGPARIEVALTCGARHAILTSR